MGMFDEISGKVKCPKCDKETNYYEQFKWSDCLLFNYELGDTVSSGESYYGYDRPEGKYHLEESHTTCDQCQYQFNSYAVLRNMKIIAFLNHKELENLELDSLPDVEDNYTKKERYRKSCEDAIGLAKEYEDFELHPKKPRDTIVALGHTWMIKKVYKEWLSETDPQKVAWLKLRGCLGRKSTDSYIYKVYCKGVGNRYIKVEDRMPWRDFGNIKVTKNYVPDRGYTIKRIY
jgi:hypothetical protein